MFYFVVYIFILYNKVRNFNINSFIILNFQLRQNFIYNLEEKAFVRCEFNISYSGFSNWMKMILFSNIPEFLTCHFFRCLLFDTIAKHLFKKGRRDFSFSESRDLKFLRLFLDFSF